MCPRCGTTAPPSDAPLLTCASCKLGFDPRAEPVARPRRPERKEYAPAPPGVTIRREPGEWTIAWSFDRIKGAGALGLGVLCAAMLVGNLSTPDEQWYHLAALAVAALGMLYVGALWSFGHTVLRIDSKQVYARREPFRWGRMVWADRDEIENIVLRVPKSEPEAWEIVLVTPRGELVAARFAWAAKDLATCVVDTLREALDEIEVG